MARNTIPATVVAAGSGTEVTTGCEADPRNTAVLVLRVDEKRLNVVLPGVTGVLAGST